MKEAHRRIDKSFTVSRFELLPYDAIEQVIWNEELLHTTSDPHLRRFLNPDYLLNQAALFSVGNSVYSESSKEQQKLQSRGARRAFTLRFGGGFVDEYNTAYGQISVKGVGTSKKDLDANIPSEDPRGLFGEQHAVQDLHVSNVFAEHGGRTSRGIAIITLDHINLLKWYKTFQDPPYKLEEELAKVEDNGDRVCLYVRLTGADRWDELMNFECNSSTQNQLHRAMVVIREEVKARGLQAFQERYCMSSSNLLLSLQQIIANKNPFSASNALENIYRHFFYFNKGVGRVVSQKHFGNRMTFNLHSGNQDLTGMWIDWENALPESGQQMHRLESVFGETVSTHEEKVFLRELSENSVIAGRVHAENVCNVHET